MKFKDRSAFVTGGASGIGLALARECVANGARVILTDVEPSALERAVNALRGQGADVVGLQLDVSNAAQYEAVAAEVLAEYGVPYLLFNNAGVATAESAATASIADWTWLVGVNIMGVAHGLSLFAPKMIEAGQGGYVVNTASIAGLASPRGPGAIYSMTKHAIIALSEGLAHELRPHGVHVSVLCPGRVATNLTDAQRNRPPGAPDGDVVEPGAAEARAASRAWLAAGLAPEALARSTFDAMAERRFYVISHPEYRDFVKSRMEQLLNAFKGEPSTDVDDVKALLAAGPLEPLM